MQTLKTPDTSRSDLLGPGAVRQWISPKRAGRIAGISYLAMFLLAIFANFVVLETMVVADDGPATLANISESLGMFRLGAVAFLAIALLDVVIAWALYVVFRRRQSRLGADFRMVPVGIRSDPGCRRGCLVSSRSTGFWRLVDRTDRPVTPTPRCWKRCRHSSRSGSSGWPPLESTSSSWESLPFVHVW